MEIKVKHCNFCTFCEYDEDFDSFLCRLYESINDDFLCLDRTLNNRPAQCPLDKFEHVTFSVKE